MAKRNKDVEQQDGFRFTIPEDCGLTVREAYDLLRERQKAKARGDDVGIVQIEDIFKSRGLVLKDISDNYVAVSEAGQ